MQPIRAPLVSEYKRRACNGVSSRGGGGGGGGDAHVPDEVIAAAPSDEAVVRTR